MTNTTHPLDASAAAARAALIRRAEERDARNAAEAAEVAPILARLSDAQKRALDPEEPYWDHTLCIPTRTARALERHGLVHDLRDTGVGATVWARYTKTGGKVYRALRHEQWMTRKAEMEAESAALS